MPLGATRELQTLTTALDLLIEGRVLSAGDLLSQRLLARELAAAEGSWNVAQHVEILPKSASGVTAELRRTAARREAADLKLTALLEKAR